MLDALDRISGHHEGLGTALSSAMTAGGPSNLAICLKIDFKALRNVLSPSDGTRRM